MVLKLKKGTGVNAFLNKDIFYVDVKQVKLDPCPHKLICEDVRRRSTCYTGIPKGIHDGQTQRELNHFGKRWMD